MNTYTALTDRQLTDRLNDRDLRAYEELYRRYWEVMYVFACKMAEDSDEAKDIVQDSFVRLYAQIGKADFRQIDIAPYLYTIVKNTFINLVNRNKRNEIYINSLRHFAEAGEFITDEKIMESEVIRQLEQEIAQLPRRMRAVFEMSRKGYLTHKQIAEATDLSENTVKSQISRALKLLRSRFSAFFFLQLMHAILWINRSL